MMAPHRTARLTISLTVVTGLAWIAAQLWGAQDWVAEQAGFIPLRFAGQTSGFVIPEWLTQDRDKLAGKVNRVPTREEIDPIVNEQLVVELYSR